MNRIVICGVAIFLAVVGLSLLGSDKEAVAGGGIYGCSGYVVTGCSGYVGCHGCHGAVVTRGCHGCYGSCHGRRVRVRHMHGHCGCSMCATSCGGVVQKGGVVTQKGSAQK